MAIICVKIGCNEPSTYKKYDKLSYHGDIIDVLPRKNGKEDRSPGVEVSKKYLCIKVDTSHLSDKEFEEFRSMLTQRQYEDTGEVDADGKKILRQIAKRRFNMDLVNANFLSLGDKSVINSVKTSKENNVGFDISSVSKTSVALNATAVNPYIIDKVDGKSLEEKPVTGIG